MSAEQGGEAKRGLPLMLRDLGIYASWLHSDIVRRCEESMPFEPDETPYWTDTDIQAFGSLADFIQTAHAIDERTERPIDGLYPKVGRLFKPLPITEDGREWIYDASSHDWYRQPGDDRAMEFERSSKHNSRTAIDHQIITVGDREGADRRDFVRRWAAWRRRRDEFTDLRAFQRVNEALMDIGFEMCPGGPSIEYVNSPSRTSF